MAIPRQVHPASGSAPIGWYGLSYCTLQVHQYTVVPGIPCYRPYQLQQLGRDRWLTKQVPFMFTIAWPGQHRRMQEGTLDFFHHHHLSPSRSFILVIGYLYIVGRHGLVPNKEEHICTIWIHSSLLLALLTKPEAECF